MTQNEKWWVKFAWREANFMDWQIVEYDFDQEARAHKFARQMFNDPMLRYVISIMSDRDRRIRRALARQANMMRPPHSLRLVLESDVPALYEVSIPGPNTFTVNTALVTFESCGWRNGDGTKWEWWNVIVDGRIMDFIWYEARR